MSRMIRRWFFALASILLSWCAVLLTPAYAAEQCEPIRPPGLSAAQVEQIVLEKISEALELPVARIDRSNSIKDLDGTGNAILRYSLIVVSVGDALGVDSAEVFYKAATAKGKSPPFQSLSVAEIQSLARRAYFASPDAPFPLVKPGARYHTRRFVAAVPKPTDGWLMLACYSDQFVFQHHDPVTGDVSTAIARDVVLEPFKSNTAFLAQARAAADSLAPMGYVAQSINVEIVPLPGAPCALMQLQGDMPAAIALGGERKPYTVVARFCYDAKLAHLGYAALYSNLGNLSAQAVRERALVFFRGVTPP